MEVAGLAIGIVSIASLFSTCLDLVEKVDDYKNFSRDSRTLVGVFEAEKLRLRKWGVDVGIGDGVVLDSHHPALDDPETQARVAELLRIIQEVSRDSGNTTDLQEVPIESKRTAERPFFTSQVQSTPKAVPRPKRRRLAWAIRGKAEREAQVLQFARLVELLHNLVPAGRLGPVAADSLTNDLSEKLWVSDIRQTLSHIKKLQEEKEVENRQKLYSWLGHVSSEELFEDAVSRRLDGTCDWILDQPIFVEWLSSSFAADDVKLLWINGAAGFGKTVMCSRIVEHLISTQTTPVATFFISSDFESRDDPYAAVRSWVAQIIDYDQSAFDLANERWLAQREKVATKVTTLKLLSDITRAVPGCTLVVDGLDECTHLDQSPRAGNSVSDFLELLMEALTGTSTRILVVSRNEPQIRGPIANLRDFSEIHLSLEDVQPDVVRYSRSIIDRKLARKDDDTKNNLSERMADRCGGQFLWLKMQESSLSSWKSKKQLETIIDETPTGLQHLYERNWSRIASYHDQDKDRAMSLLRWAAFALRPLTVEEITEAIMVDSQHTEFPVDEMPDLIDEDYINEGILGPCGSLLEIRNVSTVRSPGQRTVHLAHFSIKEFFLSNTLLQTHIMANSILQQSYEVQASAILAKACLQYIGYPQDWNESPEFSSSHVRMAFREYAGRFWFQHANVCGGHDITLVGAMTALFSETNPVWKKWTRWLDFENMSTEVTDSDSPAGSPLFYAAGLGLGVVVEHLLQTANASLNDRSQLGQTAFSIACTKGNTDIVKALAAANADITIPDNDGRSPLYSAARYGHADIVSFLIQKGADITIPNKYGYTPINVASDDGHIEVVKMLLERGADISVANEDGWTPVISAASEGHTEIVKLLLDKGADLTVRENDGWTALNRASDAGHLETVKLLLENGAEINNAGNEDNNWTPLGLSSSKGHTEIAKLLLEKGANVNDKGQDGWTALNLASDNGHVDIVKILLDRGADITTSSNSEWTPLDAASSEGHSEVVKLLLESGAVANINAHGSEGWTALNLAVHSGHVKVVKLLLDNGADPSVRNKDGWTALNLAADAGETEAVKLLLEKGVDVNSHNDGWAALSLASHKGHAEVAKLLLEQGANVNNSEDNQPPLLAAATGGHSEVIKLLLDHGADVDKVNDDQWTALTLAADIVSVESVKLLLDNGADIDLTSNGWTALNLAAREGLADTVRLLLDRGADTSISFDEGWTPLCTSANEGHAEVVKLLLDGGADINLALDDNWTPLNLASIQGYTEVVEALLEKGPDIEMAHSEGGRPLHSAAEKGFFKIVKLLLDRGADINAINDEKATALNVASAQGQVEVVKLLLNSGADITITDQDEDTPLSSAEKGEHEEVIRILKEWADGK